MAMPELSPISVAFLVFPNVTQLDLTGPAQVLSRLGNVTLNLVWKDTDPVPTDAGFPLLPTATFEQVSQADILCVPGGLGTMDIMQDAEVLDWLRKMAARADWVTSVCTGSLVLGAAGLLKGYRSACHWASVDQLAYFGATPVRERIVEDRNRFSGGGVTSGIDFALALAARIRGEDFAQFIQLSIEYDPHPPFDAGSPAKVSPEILERYYKLIEAAVPDRDAKVKAIADSLGF
ncbi:MAG: DJ-1/PfpI family protein [Alphaproteobacteria bacterium]|nr:DJ-1/PfpI family protein [Alphaproteobacteria bacterium]